MLRIDGRTNDQLRPILFKRGVVKYAEGSCYVEQGDTRLICTATVEDDKVPPFLKGTGSGWITAEYGMLPRSTRTRIPRESSKNFPIGRVMEIRRMIGRSLRAAFDLQKLGERTITVDCDVITADGGTRCAAINGGFIAVVEALHYLKNVGILKNLPILDFIGSVSGGIVMGREMIDLCFEEDSTASVDMNLVMTEKGKIVEIQATAEGAPFSKEQFDHLIEMAKPAILHIISLQKEVLKDILEKSGG
ncbi:ribonuclease PH [bacterium]|nr:ribonuclease PH [bacterium]